MQAVTCTCAGNPPFDFFPGPCGEIDNGASNSLADFLLVCFVYGILRCNYRYMSFNLSYYIRNIYSRYNNSNARKFFVSGHRAKRSG